MSPAAWTGFCAVTTRTLLELVEKIGIDQTIVKLPVGRLRGAVASNW
jgi:hypothetical protein